MTNLCSYCALPVRSRRASAICSTCRETDPRAGIFHNAKHRAKTGGLPFDLSPTDISIPAVCPVLGVPFVRGCKDHAPTLDKLVPSLGYVRGNVAVISSLANRVKNDASLEVLLAVTQWVQKSFGDKS